MKGWSKKENKRERIHGHTDNSVVIERGGGAGRGYRGDKWRWEKKLSPATALGFVPQNLGFFSTPPPWGYPTVAMSKEACLNTLHHTA